MIYSDYLKNPSFMWLYSILKAGKAMAFEEVPDEKRELFSDIIQDLLVKCSDEWIQTKGPNNQYQEDMGESKEKWKRCSLCNEPNKYIFYIENTLNKCKLNVGSECITEFGSIAGSAKKSKSYMQRNSQRSRRLQALLEAIPKVRSTVENWHHFIENLLILLSEQETMHYEELGVEANKSFEKILNKGLNENDVNHLKKIISSGKLEQRKILNRIELLKKQDFILTKQQADWIRSHQPENFQTVLDCIKYSQDSQITLSCAHLISEKSFLEFFARKYNSVRAEKNVTFMQLYNDWQRNIVQSKDVPFETELPEIKQVNSGSYQFEFASLQNIHFTLSCSKFISKLGFLVFPNKKENLDPSDILQIVAESSLASYDSYDAFFYQIESIMDRFEKGNRFNLYRLNMERNYVDFRVFNSAKTDAEGNITYIYSYNRYKLIESYEKIRGILLKKNAPLLLDFLEKDATKTFTEYKYKIETEEELELSKMNK
ncbi:hypothetical protein HCB27_10730 [Listeria booriae]|uniref:Uncharacterized protein n=1 Tax=Listeria booriae TaxID=1552123 RepID=A0A7X0Z840_9LIST|nr:hypothetical protein [Listeria booriae]MBC2177094.1 hypothetical protein [Listeria booriae]